MKTLLAAVVGATLALAATQARAATPGERQVALEIESRTLAEALDQWALKGGFQIIVKNWPLTKKLPAPTLKGTFSARAALEQLLEGTPLTYDWVSDNHVTIREKQNVGSPASWKTTDGSAKQQAAPGSRFLSDGLSGHSAASADDGSAAGPGRSRASDLYRDNRAGPVEEIIVTGTHIQGIQNATVPLVVIDREHIERMGYSTTQDVVRSLPQNFAGGQAGASDDGIFGLSATAGSNFTSASGINLRGLGNSSTLVLLNGRRMAPSAYGSIVDVSLIPLAAVERIEILLDGSSALYGSDAVGGVVNIITREEYEGATTALRYGAARSSSRSDRVVAQTIGGNWSSGNLVATAQYQEQTELRAADRDFTSDLTQPNDLLPSTEAYGLALNARQQLTDTIQLYADSLLSQRDIDRKYSFPDVGGITGESEARSRGINAASGLQYQVTPAWSVDLGAHYSEQLSDRSRRQVSEILGQQSSVADVTFREIGADLLLNGTLFTTTAGKVGAALGASYRREKLDRREVLIGGTPLDGDFERNVRALYGEVYVPLVGDSNALPMVRSLALSGAVRWDDYSTFGSTSTPRIGVHWEPISQLSLRAAYSRSFRAPDPSELFNTGVAFIFVFPFQDPSGSLANALVLTGSQPTLDPERARIHSFGVEYKPDLLPGLSLSADYYRVRYNDRIVLPNFDINALLQPAVYGSLITPLGSDAEAEQFLETAIASGAEYFDDGSGVVGVRHAVDFRQQNAALVRQSGVDVQIRYRRDLVRGAFASAATLSTIDSIDTAFATGAASADIVSTLGNPVDLRVRWDVGWNSDRWMFNGAVNYIDDYVNTAAPGSPRIDSWMTFDLVGQMKLDGFSGAAAFKGATLTLSVHNLFDEKPPFVDAPALISVNYDPANASPLQRAVAIEFVKTW